MSDVAQGPDWWLASDGKWYAPETHPDFQAPVPSSEVPEAESAEQPSRLWYKKKGIIALGVAALILIIVVGNAGKKSTSTNASSTQTTTATTAAPSDTTTPATAPPTTSAPAPTTPPTTTAPPPPPPPALSSGAENAVREANSYLNTSAFSRQGLIDQLSSSAGSGYSVADATAAVDSMNIDYNAQAVKSAKSYLAMSGFSCQGLIDQLSSTAGDQYTVDQATFGAQQAGAC